jgi:hypothetical protein
MLVGLNLSYSNPTCAGSICFDRKRLKIRESSLSLLSTAASKQNLGKTAFTRDRSERNMATTQKPFGDLFETRPSTTQLGKRHFSVLRLTEPFVVKDVDVTKLASVATATNQFLAELLKRDACEALRADKSWFDALAKHDHPVFRWLPAAWRVGDPAGNYDPRRSFWLTPSEATDGTLVLIATTGVQGKDNVFHPDPFGHAIRVVAHVAIPKQANEELATLRFTTYTSSLPERSLEDFTNALTKLEKQPAGSNTQVGEASANLSASAYYFASDGSDRFHFNLKGPFIGGVGEGFGETLFEHRQTVTLDAAPDADVRVERFAMRTHAQDPSGNFSVAAAKKSPPAQALRAVGRLVASQATQSRKPPSAQLDADSDIDLPQQPAEPIKKKRKGPTGGSVSGQAPKPSVQSGVQLRSDRVEVISAPNLSGLAKQKGNTKQSPASSVAVYVTPKTKGQTKLDARETDVAQATAYSHANDLFTYIENSGISAESFFKCIKLPLLLAIDAPILPGAADGVTVNAQVTVTKAGRHVDHRKSSEWLADRPQVEVRFAKANLSCQLIDPDEIKPKKYLSVATDPRWAWHEFGHVLIVAATGDLELPFVHSIGDALAAIIHDVDSELRKEEGRRGSTFPWVEIPRRHDRCATSGWCWSGGLHEPSKFWSGQPGQSPYKSYTTEQILSSTLFALYREIGGDDNLETTRKNAADHVVTLLVRALALLGPASHVAADSVQHFVAALLDAEETMGGKHSHQILDAFVTKFKMPLSS